MVARSLLTIQNQKNLVHDLRNARLVMCLNLGF